MTTQKSPLEVRVCWALLALRISLGLFLLQWGLEKFIIADTSAKIFAHFYGISLPLSAAPVVGVLECALALAVLAGFWQRWSYGAAFAVHSISVASSWRQLIDPYGLIGGTVNHLFAAGVPVLVGFWVLYWLREWDLTSWDARRRRI
jgi:uncharacterized membrane protein YphA (DoxX/SURF4 family)